MRSKSKGVRDDGGKSQAVAWHREIVGMVADLRRAFDANDENAEERARERIQESALSVEVRSGWYSPGCPDDDRRKPEEGCILLCTGGPAVRILCNLSEHGEPTDVVIEYQDWGTPWTEYHPGGVAGDDTLERFAGCFYFGG